MSSRMFQGVVLQMKDGIDRVVGVIDADGIVVACSELTSIGEHWSGAVAAINAADNGITRYEGKTFKPLAGWGAQFDYAAFVQGRTRRARPCAPWRWWPSTEPRPLMRRSTTKPPL